MHSNKNLSDNLDEFNLIYQDLESCPITLDEQHTTIMLLNSLFEKYDILRDIIEFGQQSLTLDTVIHAVKIIELRQKESSGTEVLLNATKKVRCKKERPDIYQRRD